MTAISRISTTCVRAAIALGLALVATLGLAAPAAASKVPIGWQASGGWYTDNDDVFLGVGARLGLAIFTVIPNVEYVFVDRGNAYTINVDGTKTIVPLGIATGYVGAGVGMFIVDPENGESNTEGVVNLIVGAGLNATRLMPFGQFKWILVDGDDPMVFSVGIRF